MKFKKKIEFLVKHENQSLSACEGGGGGGEIDGMDLGESHGLKGERRGASRRQQSMKGGGLRN